MAQCLGLTVSSDSLSTLCSSCWQAPAPGLDTAQFLAREDRAGMQRGHPRHSWMLSVVGNISYASFLGPLHTAQPRGPLLSLLPSLPTFAGPFLICSGVLDKMQTAFLITGHTLWRTSSFRVRYGKPEQCGEPWVPAGCRKMQALQPGTALGAHRARPVLKTACLLLLLLLLQKVEEQRWPTRPAFPGSGME